METILNKKYPLIYREVTFNTPVFDKRYRSSFEIVALILETANEGANRFTIAKN
jgi:hypothetical protein